MRTSILIVEGPQGVGKTSITNYLRDHILYSNLYRLTGLKDQANPNAPYLTEQYHMRILLAAYQGYQDGIIHILDRSFTTNIVYTRLKYNNNDFEQNYKNCMALLKGLATIMPVCYFNLTASADALTERLNRDRPNYQKVQYSLKASQEQMPQYRQIATDMQSIGVHTQTIDTTHKTVAEVGKFIIDYLQQRNPEF